MGHRSPRPKANSKLSQPLEITDYNAEDESMADPDIEKKDAEVGEEVDVAVEEQEEEDKEGFEIDEEEDEEEEELIIGSDSARKFWVQRQISEVYSDRVTAAENATSVLSILGSESRARDCENQLMDLFDFQGFHTTVKFLKNSDVGVGWILREMASDQAKPRSDAMDVGGPKIEVPKKPTVERVQSKVFPIASVQTNLFCLVHQLVRERSSIAPVEFVFGLGRESEGKLAVIVQMEKRLGTNNLFVSMLDYHSDNLTETLIDLIRRVPGMTQDPSAAYRPLEEANMRNLALTPLQELEVKRNIKFASVIWLKGFTCPNNILETIKISFAAMVCGMDWAEHDGFLIFSGCWRMRHIEGDQFKQSKPSSEPNAVPPRDKQGDIHYAQHLPFQVFCCESGTHAAVVLQWRQPPLRDGLTDPLKTHRAWDLWVRGARDALNEVDLTNGAAAMKKRDIIELAARDRALKARRDAAVLVKPRDEVKKSKAGEDENAGSDYDAMSVEDGGEIVPPPEVGRLSMPNSVFRPARILVNPRCPTMCARVSHTQLAGDLFGEGGDDAPSIAGKYVLEDWEGAQESFACQEQRQSGGRKATKTKRRLGFLIHVGFQRPPV
ncbi:hypothetical protein K443DRAFT_123143 [Laccaria amethystina LaAM-08-1]|uniref:Brr2 N-terminal helicase PWI domain-containing protein n=1 Tax=Laccaria amethystina LaAM-08-1 TaxID=1095629 RepID=A0A0C9X3M8_9AGAR|nr:hypothetical protein K443DRAFT_123143 [Laccaria amethystina LaAM-08-1]